jgi:TPP-dependent pyruvate/acetoin dehydrogenase alpha subunit
MEKSFKEIPDISILRKMLSQLLTIRLFEEALYRAFLTEKLPGTMHQTNGEEAIAVGVGLAIDPGDVMTSTHRGHGHAIAKGIPLNTLMAEMYARATGASGGMGGSMHIFDLARGFLGTTGVVGAGVPIAVGSALALKLEVKKRLAVAFLGDGAMNQGSVQEALNLAAVWQLPIIFVCENNGYAVSHPTYKAFAIERLTQRATGYGIEAVTLDGNDVLEVYSAVRKAAAKTREGEGPFFLECITYRQKGHSRFEPATYRPSGELQAWLAKDPIERFRTFLSQNSLISSDEQDEIKQRVNQEIQAAILFARSSPAPTVNDTLALSFKG